MLIFATACSAALAANHAGLRSLHCGECINAISSGVNILLNPAISFGFATAGMTSRLGRCHTFDQRADGYARGESCCAAALETSASSIQMVGSAVRQDGKSASLTAPNGQAQRRLLIAGTGRLGCTSRSLSLLEAHGTGTALGDPIEMGSLAEAVLMSQLDRVPLAASSVKSNSGHAEPAAGIAGLVVLAETPRGCCSEECAVECAQYAREGFTAAVRVRVAVAARKAAKVRRGRISTRRREFFCGYSGTIVHQVVRRSLVQWVDRGVGSLVLNRRSFPWRRQSDDMEETSSRAFYCLRWQVSAASRVQPVDTATSLIMVETRWLGAASLAMKAARLAQMQLGNVRSVRELSVASRCGYVVVLLDAAESVAPSLHGVRAVVRVVQQMTRLAQPAPQLMLLTGGVQASSPSAGALNASSAAHGGAWGLGRVVRLEQPSWRVVSADLLADCWLPDAVGELIGEGGASSGAPTELVWRGGERQSAMLSWNASVGQPSRMMRARRLIRDYWRAGRAGATRAVLVCSRARGALAVVAQRPHCSWWARTWH